jgi:predicted O-methyltransferase YrrM
MSPAHRLRAVRVRRLAVRIAPAFLLLLALVPLAGIASPTDEDPDQAQERLAWMRDNQTGMWNISPREGLYLYNLVIKHHLKRGLEIGTSNGYSSIWVASGMSSTGGHLLTLEIDEERAKLARENFDAAGVASFVTLEQVDALEEIPKLQGKFDFVFIDAGKSDYVRFLDMVLPLVPPGGVIVAHNVKDMADALQDFIQRVKTHPQLKTTFVKPGPGGFSVSIKRRSE